MHKMMMMFDALTDSRDFQQVNLIRSMVDAIRIDATRWSHVSVLPKTGYCIS